MKEPTDDAGWVVQPVSIDLTLIVKHCNDAIRNISVVRRKTVSPTRCTLARFSETWAAGHGRAADLHSWMQRGTGEESTVQGLFARQRLRPRRGKTSRLPICVVDEFLQHQDDSTALAPVQPTREIARALAVLDTCR